MKIINYFLLLMVIILPKVNASPTAEVSGNDWDYWWLNHSQNQCVGEMLESRLTSPFTYEILCKYNDPHKTQCIRGIRNAYFGPDATVYERMCRNANEDTVDCIMSANASRVGGLDYGMCLNASSFTGMCIKSVADIGFTIPTLYGELCNYANEEKIMCINTVRSIGMKVSNQYVDLCFRADRARVGCLTKVHSYGMTDFAAFKSLCIGANESTVACYDAVNSQGYKNISSYKLFCHNADENRSGCLTATQGINFETPGMTISTLCSQANEHSSSCIETISSIGIGKDDDFVYTSLCENPNEEMVQCYRNLHNAKVSDVRVFRDLCTK